MFSPPNRILDLARHKTSKTIWATTPCEKLNWGNQEPIWPLSPAALTAVPSARIRHLSQHRGGLSARDQHLRKQHEEGAAVAAASFFRKGQRTSPREPQHQHIVRLSTPKTRGAQEVRSPLPDTDGPSRRGTKAAAATSLRLLQLSQPKQTHPDYQGRAECGETIASMSSKKPRVSRRLLQLSLPRLRESDTCRRLGPPEEPIWNVPRTAAAAAAAASASARVEELARPKQLSKNYIPPREPEWSRRASTLQSSHHSYIHSAFRQACP
ncbi:sperm microtubule associated protein 2 like isoform X2 [Nelusetta ayraudi]|uniref:sperm microtubule associated protein 2 like isoform X2 n=1 Tax=Nelusetta ayraudi TaxID=303726 RepID=UPI003F6EE6CE